MGFVSMVLRKFLLGRLQLSLQNTIMGLMLRNIVVVRLASRLLRSRSMYLIFSLNFLDRSLCL